MERVQIRALQTAILSSLVGGALFVIYWDDSPVRDTLVALATTSALVCSLLYIRPYVKDLEPSVLQLVKLWAGLMGMCAGVALLIISWPDLGLALILTSGFLLTSFYVAHAALLAGHFKGLGARSWTPGAADRIEDEKANLQAAIVASSGITLGLVSLEQAGAETISKVGAVTLAVTVVVALLHLQALGGLRIQRSQHGGFAPITSRLEAILLNLAQALFVFGLVSVGLGLL